MVHWSKAQAASWGEGSDKGHCEWTLMVRILAFAIITHTVLIFPQQFCIIEPLIKDTLHALGTEK
jgi:hypothetical protein